MGDLAQAVPVPVPAQALVLVQAPHSVDPAYLAELGLHLAQAVLLQLQPTIQLRRRRQHQQRRLQLQLQRRLPLLARVDGQSEEAKPAAAGAARAAVVEAGLTASAAVAARAAIVGPSSCVLDERAGEPAGTIVVAAAG